MHWIAFLAACLALILARLLRAPDRSTLLTGAAGFLLAFLVTSFAVRLVSDEAGLRRPNDYNGFITYAGDQAANDPEAPIVLFLGASFSRNGLDDELLTEELRKLGYPHRVINLSLEGASLQERDAHLRDFLRFTGIVPDVVFLEAAREFDADPVYVFRIAKFSDRAIEQFTPQGSYWAAKGLSQGQCHGLAACGKSWALLSVHTALNLSNLGLLATGESVIARAPISSFDPQDTPRETFTLTADEISAELSVIEAASPADGPVWAKLFRAEQRDDLSAAGVRRIAYYYPPVLPAGDRAYVSGLCLGELSDFPCISPDDPRLLSGLKREVWFDEKHLLRDGSRAYTVWLAREIDRTEALK